METLSTAVLAPLDTTGHMLSTYNVAARQRLSVTKERSLVLPVFSVLLLLLLLMASCSPEGVTDGIPCPSGTTRLTVGGTQPASCGPCQKGYTCESNVPFLCPAGYYW
jgi:hypothetical protein